MIISDKDGVFRHCEELGEEAVRARLQGASLTVFERPFMQEWLNLRDAARQARETTEKREREDRVISIADRAAAAAERSAGAAERSARIAMIAAVVALLSIAIAVAKSCSG